MKRRADKGKADGGGALGKFYNLQGDGHSGGRRTGSIGDCITVVEL